MKKNDLRNLNPRAKSAIEEIRAIMKHGSLEEAAAAEAEKAEVEAVAALVKATFEDAEDPEDPAAAAAAAEIRADLLADSDLSEETVEEMLEQVRFERCLARLAKAKSERPDTTRIRNLIRGLMNREQ
jgi:vacuolar-type H+-ATPase subunit C/Vma6